MHDRIFAAALMIATLIYGYFALFVIRAPFQYDPLGPETWPKLLAGTMLLCLAALFLKPDVRTFDLGRPGALRLLALLALLLAYAELFEPLGFILTTFGFSTLCSRMMGAKRLPAALFGLGMGVGGYLLCAGLLDLNLPAGPLPGL